MTSLIQNNHSPFQTFKSTTGQDKLEILAYDEPSSRGLYVNEYALKYPVSQENKFKFGIEMRGEDFDILLALRLELGILKLTSICEKTTKLKKNKTNCLEITQK